VQVVVVVLMMVLVVMMVSLMCWWRLRLRRFVLVETMMGVEGEVAGWQRWAHNLLS
jgi:hypothetical protein